MDVVMMYLPEVGYPVEVIGSRRSARREVCVPTTIANKGGLTNGVVTDISETGCALQLTMPLVPSQYLTLKLFPRDGLAAVQITLAELRWFGREWASVKFVSLSQADKAHLKRLCTE